MTKSRKKYQTGDKPLDRVIDRLTKEAHKRTVVLVAEIETVLRQADESK